MGKKNSAPDLYINFVCERDIEGLCKVVPREFIRVEYEEILVD